MCRYLNTPIEHIKVMLIRWAISDSLEPLVNFLISIIVPTATVFTLESE
jgi:hypothetical protein